MLIAISGNKLRSLDLSNGQSSQNTPLYERKRAKMAPTWMITELTAGMIKRISERSSEIDHRIELGPDSGKAASARGSAAHL